MREDVGDAAPIVLGRFPRKNGEYRRSEGDTEYSERQLIKVLCVAEDGRTHALSVDNDEGISDQIIDERVDLNG